VHKESKNGAEIYPVYVRRRSGEVRRPWTGFSGEAKSDSLLGELHQSMHGLFRGSGVAGKGYVGRSTVAGGFIGAGASRGHEHGSARREARGVRRGRALARSECVEHVEVFFCPCSTAR
jgi:hypothetical protein